MAEESKQTAAEAKTDKESRAYTASKGDLAFQERKRWGFLGLPFTFTLYKIYENDIQIRAGFLNVKVDDCLMYRISDVSLDRSLTQRIFGLGTVSCYTSDTTDKVMKLKNIRHSEEIKDYILQTSEEARLRRRTINMQNVGASEHLDPHMMDMDDIQDLHDLH